MSTEQKPKKVKVGALWLRQDGSGNDYYSGVLDTTGQRIVIFKNMFTENPAAPTHIIYEDNRPPQEKGAAKSSGGKATPSKAKATSKAMKVEEAEEFPVVNESDIPF